MIIPESTVIEIDAGSIEDSRAKEIFRNLQVLYNTRAGEQGLDRDFGIDWNPVDCPTESVKALMAAEYVRKTERYEPRAHVLSVDWVSRMAGDKKPENGVMVPKVVVSFG